MDCQLPSLTYRFLKRESRVFEPGLIKIIDVTVGQSAPYQAGNRVKRLLELLLQEMRLAQRILQFVPGLDLFGDVDARADDFHDFARFIRHWLTDAVQLLYRF